MQQYRPNGPAPIKLEADILRLRAYEMVLTMFYVEDLKKFIVDSIRATEKLGGSALGDKKVMESAFRILVDSKVLSDSESSEVQDLIGYRNVIAHHVQDITGDVGAFADLGFSVRYDQSALSRVKNYRRKIFEGMRRGFILSMGFRELQFDAAERVYVREIRRLRQRVDKGIKELTNAINLTKENIAGIPALVMEQADPGHPQQHRRNGTLSKRGIACCYLLFENGATPLAVSYLMHISLRAAKAWEKKWKDESA